jgi:ubiquinone/menaquinone biosynthesis C-methylase UbiE
MQSNRPGIDVFDKDATANEGYLYTQTERLSCRLATQRTTEAILGAREFEGRSVLDLACGDAHYSFQFSDRSSMTRFVATDGASNAVSVAARRQGTRPMSFLVSDAHALPFADDSFDVVLVQSVLHHDERPWHMIREAFRVAPRIVVHEPNGNNLGLKVIEKVSPYHKEHGEKSYSSVQMKRWIREAGGEVVYQKFAGFVPMFCSDGLARMMKFIEPAVESLPLFRCMACAVYVMVGVRRSAQPLC